jgi:hypothetical protein
MGRWRNVASDVTPPIAGGWRNVTSDAMPPIADAGMDKVELRPDIDRRICYMSIAGSAESTKYRLESAGCRPNSRRLGAKVSKKKILIKERLILRGAD